MSPVRCCTPRGPHRWSWPCSTTPPSAGSESCITPCSPDGTCGVCGTDPPSASCGCTAMKPELWQALGAVAVAVVTAVGAWVGGRRQAKTQQTTTLLDESAEYRQELRADMSEMKKDLAVLKS